MNEKGLFPLALYLANDRREREFQASARERSVVRQPRPSVRRSVGQSIVRFGDWLAGETYPTPVRSR
ncbi:MAG TPA: hypothetical protein VHS36_05380 [Candidatus Limnocylindrales bacterium]|jgi:hypothetical protein|nr:hypothetical protein [Candidatus Limnocylindrales bacterium]